MLSGNSEDIVVDAIDSVLPWIDELLLIDTGITDATIDRARQTAGDKFVLTSYSWNGDFAAARNAAIQAAGRRDATWAMTLDTDERVNLSSFANGRVLMNQLESLPDVETWLVAADNDSYTKERFIRLPSRLSWCGRTHEALVGAGRTQRADLASCYFSELPKTAEQFRRKLHRDLVILNDVTTEMPLDSRWWHYLGQTHDGLGQKQKAIDAFEHCATLDGWSEQSAWACYCAAKCLSELKRFDETERIAAYGMTRDNSFPELPWIAGWACYQANQYERAIHWSVLAASLGDYSGNHAAQHRIGFRFVPGWYEAPYDTLRFAYRRIGSDSEADVADQNYELAKQMRLQRVKPLP